MSETEMVVIIVMTICASIVTLSGMVLFFRRRKDAPTAMGAGPDAVRLSAQLSEVQSQLDAMQVELERLGEGQRFTTKLLSDKRAGDRIGG